ncbi:PAS/PAC sensor signal transduction histidine kinase [Tamilnaduibacter salinus]|uniref:Sensory histidine kinase/phosphatase NtrB n=1 Tax=Tamilnaduibacter salinus TaxID=1484056 RepID=A0A2U1CU49_9GAMM|nr:nitrogen regulation protein NR(II) [Tamilnaduibacter salinus]PVY70326.1 PAS/PAC sensor signal transduction histidine kinase [Tamilnaduibacter salinus]
MPMTIAYKQILDHLTTATVVLSRDLRVHDINAAAEYLLEASGSRVIDTPITNLIMTPDDGLETLREAAETGQPFTRREAELVLLSGSRCIVDYSVSPLSGEPDALLMEIQPRDRLLRISREEEILTQQETTRVLVRGMAHEIKNPLGGIRGAAQLLDRELTDDGQKEYTRVIIDEADRLRSLVDRMLGPRKAPELQPTNVHEVLERVRTLIDAESKGRIELIRDYDPSLPEFNGDREQLIQAFLNIARNAMEAAAENPSDERPMLTFRTRALRQFTIGHHRYRLACRIDIIDNGPGIPEELVQNIFYPMISGRANGTGLGLSITQSIIGQHHGLVECKSEPGRTDFIVFLPLEPQS